MPRQLDAVFFFLLFPVSCTAATSTRSSGPYHTPRLRMVSAALPVFRLEWEVGLSVGLSREGRTRRILVSLSCQNPPTNLALFTQSNFYLGLANEFLIALIVSDSCDMQEWVASRLNPIEGSTSGSRQRVGRVSV